MRMIESMHEAALRDLRAAGYLLVEREKRISTGNRSKFADLVAWGAGFEGEFKPLVCVEIRPSAPAGKDTSYTTLRQLSDLAADLGTTANLLFSDGKWLQADAGFMGFTPVDGPPQCPEPEGVVRDGDLLRQLLESQIWKRASLLRGKYDMATIADRALLEVLEEIEVTESGLVKQITLGVSAPARLFVETWLDLAGARKFSVGEYLAHPDLTKTMASIASALSSESVFDPFVGLGASLIAMLKPTPAANPALLGHEINPSILQTAKRLMELLSVPANLSKTDSCTNPWPKTDVIVSVLPLGLRLPEPVELPFGLTRDADVASIYWAAEALNPGGRAVLLTSRGWTGRTSAARLRQWLTENIRVTALIGLPALNKATALQSLLVVIDKTPQGDTVIADLGEDWLNQLSPDTDLWNQIARAT
jgi:hypothetical protein